jgi:Zn-dependent peptidase ImmA (M78 family)/DNA-binding XRE family transcriptional regulator
MKTNDIPKWKTVGQRVASARKALGWPQAVLADKLGLDRTAVTKIESGDRGVDTLELSIIAEFLGRPMDWFVRGEADAIVSRRDSGVANSVLDEDHRVDRVATDVKVVVDMGHLRIRRPARKRFRLQSLADAERMAEAARGFIAVSGPLRDMTGAVESLGLLAFSLDLGEQAAVGAYVSLESVGVALVNGKLPTGRRRFALAHELGHHLLLDDYDSYSDVSIGRVEREQLIDAFAAHVLLPRASVARRWRELTKSGEDVRGASVHVVTEYGVSWSALVNHLRNLDLVGEAERERLVVEKPTKREFLERGLTLWEDLAPPKIPKSYVVSVLAAYCKNKISARRAVEMLYGTIDMADLPEPDQIPLEAFSSDREPSE